MEKMIVRKMVNGSKKELIWTIKSSSKMLRNKEKSKIKKKTNQKSKRYKIKVKHP